MAARKTTEQIEALKARTRTIAVLIEIEIVVNTLKDVLKNQRPAMDQLAKIEKWKEYCMDAMSVGKERLSAGMLRDCDRISNELHAILSRHTCDVGTKTPANMCAWMWCLDTLLNDVRATHGVTGRCWRYLAQTWDKMARAWEIVSTEHDSASDPSGTGWAMYLDAADLITPGGTGLCLSA